MSATADQPQSAAQSPSADSSTLQAAGVDSPTKLPARYRQRLLQIETTVSVTLAEKRVPLGDLINLVPGSMLTFDIHCDQPLTLKAAETTIATGETVKIGDKFGLRIRHLPIAKDE